MVKSVPRTDQDIVEGNLLEELILTGSDTRKISTENMNFDTNEFDELD